eukprot:3588244-Prymnesium_polylepis.1
MYSPAKCADHIVAVMDVKDAHLVGYSFGGWVAGQTARFQPERVRSVIIGGSMMRPDDGTWVHPGAPLSQHLGARVHVAALYLLAMPVKVCYVMWWLLRCGWSQPGELGNFPNEAGHSGYWFFTGLQHHAAPMER